MAAVYAQTHNMRKLTNEDFGTEISLVAFKICDNIPFIVSYYKVPDYSFAENKER